MTWQHLQFRRKEFKILNMIKQKQFRYTRETAWTKKALRIFSQKNKTNEVKIDLNSIIKRD